MEIKYNPGIVREYRDYRQKIVASAPPVSEHQGDVVRLNARLNIDGRSDGTYGGHRSLAPGSVVGRDSGTIVERYSFDSIFGVKETAWQIDTEYHEYAQGNRTIIEKTSRDEVRHQPLSTERVDASTGEVLGEWFISDYRQRVLEPRHSC